MHKSQDEAYTAVARLLVDCTICNSIGDHNQCTACCQDVEIVKNKIAGWVKENPKAFRKEAGNG